MSLKAMVRSGFGNLNSLVALDPNDLVLYQVPGESAVRLCRVTSSDQSGAMVVDLVNPPANWWIRDTDMQWGLTPLLAIFKSAHNLGLGDADKAGSNG